MNRVIVMGSPRSNGRCAHLAEMLFEACIDECPEDELFLVPVSELDIAPCVGCGACRAKGAVPGEPTSDDAMEDETPDYPYCPRFDDDMQDIYPLLPMADELIIVSPVYFSGAPSSLKALLDRLQPHFWADSRKAPKRPATLHVVGEGGDPHGYDALISEVRSSLACAGFRLERALDWVGKIAADGEIEDEATEVSLVEKKTLVSVADVPAAIGRDSKERPKLDLGGSSRGKSASAGKGARDGGPKGGRKGRGESAKQGASNRKGDAGNGGKGHGPRGKVAGKSGGGQSKGRRRG